MSKQVVDLASKLAGIIERKSDWIQGKDMARKCAWKGRVKMRCIALDGKR